jgi:hypothetical protein
MVEKHPEPALAKLIAITLKVIATKLINHDDNHEPGMSVIGRRERVLNRAEESRG